MIPEIERTFQRIFGWGTPPPTTGIDFGNGAKLGAEDVLETHFQRLARTRPAAAETQAHPTQDKHTAVAPNRQSALPSRSHALNRAPRRPQPAPRMRSVPVQVGDTLFTAITVLAPQLAPLTALAEDVACALPLVQPAQSFRASLHSALEQTHRQHAAQRVLGTRAHARAHRIAWPLWLRLLLSALFLIGMIAGGAWLRHQRRGTTAPV